MHLAARVSYGFDFRGVDEDWLVVDFGSSHPEFITHLKSHHVSVDNIAGLYNSLHQLPELRDLPINWGHFLYNDGSSINQVISEYGKDEPSLKKIKLVAHLIEKYRVYRYHISHPTDKIRFQITNSSTQITLKEISDQLEKKN